MSNHVESMDEHRKKSIRKQNELILHEFGQHYSEKLNNEADILAEKYKDLPVPESLDEWFENYSKELKKTADRRKRNALVKKYATRAAAVLLGLLLTSAIVTISVEAFRIHFLNLFIESDEDHNRIDYIESEISLKLPEGWNGVYYPTYLPNGYNLLDAEASEHTKIVMFINPDNELLILTQNSNSMGMNIDSEKSDIEMVPINDNDGYMTNKDGMITISWSDNRTVLTLEGREKISIMLKIAEKIKKVSE